MQLRDIAFDQRNEAQALAWMSSAPVQGFLEQIANDLLSHSLDAERRAAQVKHWESTKVTHIATASLNNICARFAHERENKSLAIDAALKRLQKARKSRVESILWKNSDLRPDGIRFEQQGTHAQAYPLGSGRANKRSIDEPSDVLDAAKSELDTLRRDAKDEVDKLMQGCILPVTRMQWGEWLDDNIHEFRQLMQTAPTERRKHNTRLRARPDLPTAAPRLQPRRVVARLQNSWLLNLAGRVGWHGVATPGRLRMFYLVRHDRQTFVIDFEAQRQRWQRDRKLSYKLDDTFDLEGQLRPLSSLEATVPDANAAYSFEIDASCASGSIVIQPTRYCRITAPLPKGKQGDIGDDAGDTGDIGADSEDDVGVGVEDDDVSSQCVVDTDTVDNSDTDSDSAAARSSSSSGSEDGGCDKLIKPPVPATVEPLSPSAEDAKAKAARFFLGRKSRGILWENDYFYIPESSPGQGVRIRMRHPISKTMGGMGTEQQTKHLTPSHIGETVESCPATLLLLRAWMLARAHQDGWANAKACRKRQFAEERQSLQRDILKVQGHHGGGSLGDPRADAYLKTMLDRCPSD